MSAPSLFVSHGAPTFALAPGRVGPQLTALGSTWNAVRAIVVVSAHWQTHGVAVTTTTQPGTIHDFVGFPPQLYRLRYEPPGAPGAAQTALELLRAAGFDARADAQRGLDHGAWVPLMHIRPAADTPVFAVSLPNDLDPPTAWRLGRALAPLRSANIMLLGSGSLTHNLADYRAFERGAEPYVERFAAWVRARVRARDAAALLNYRRRAPHAVRAHPTEDHFLPLFVALGASDEHDEPTVLEGSI
ncbi:MAG: dioxygenase [Steroidobacteraceae bacterium]|nr:dioxygenase [Steroidobacteraceae bacterium]MDW8260625.1 class III extradiol ring-cleavage dioxygenase [Gammaproteobacteria bacterium]